MDYVEDIVSHFFPISPKLPHFSLYFNYFPKVIFEKLQEDWANAKKNWKKMGKHFPENSPIR